MTDETFRPDGRNEKELRSLTIDVGILDRADGSAQVKLGKNLAIASVFGPREQHPRFLAESDKAIVKVNYRMATFSVLDYKRSFPSRREKEISKVLSEAFESVALLQYFPRSAVDVHVQIFESDGGTRTAAAIAVSAALADAGIPMRDLIGGIASGLYKGKVCLDLNGEEDMKGTGDMPILYAPELDEVSLFQLDGKFTLEQFKEAFYTSTESIKIIVENIKDALRQRYLKVREEVGISDEGDEKDEEIQSFIQDEFIAAPAETTPEPVVEEKEEKTPTYPSTDASSFDPDDVPAEESAPVSPEPVEDELATPQTVEDELATPQTVEEEPVTENIPAAETSPESTEEKKSDEWHDKPDGLKPMDPKINEEGDDVIRDIEYSSLEEEED